MAAATAMEGFDRVPQLSGNLGYGLVCAQQTLGEVPDNVLQEMLQATRASSREELRNIINEGSNIAAFAQVFSEFSLPPQENFEAPLQFPKKLSDIPNRRYRATGILYAEGSHANVMGPLESRSPNFNMNDIKRLIANGYYPVVLTGSDSRTYVEDWMQINPVGGFAHAEVLIGYGRDQSAIDGIEKDYFLSIDSMSLDPIAYKVSANDIALNLVGFVLITGVDTQASPRQIETTRSLEID